MVNENWRRHWGYRIARLLGPLRHRRFLLIDTVLLGVVGALGAQLFLLLLRLVESFFLGSIAGYQPPGVPTEGGVLTQVIGPHGLWLLPVVTTLGGLISGILVYSLAPEAEGHGTDSAIKAFHQAGGFIRARVPPIKMISSAITIGSGGSAGREGPAAQFSAGIGSVYATLTHRPEGERRLLVLVGMAAGLSAIFRSPIGTAFMAVEVLYGGIEFEAGALLYTLLASVVAYTVNGLFVGWEPLFQIPQNMAAPAFVDYFRYAALGLSAGVVATLIPPVFYGMRDAFKAIPIPPHFKPAIGGFLVGVVGLVLPQAIGGGYGWIQEAINGQMAATLLLVLVFAKILTVSFSISSGGSGGVFGPSVFIGAMLGAFFGSMLHQPVAAFAVVGMAAVFGGAGRVPIATMIMVTEMTGGYRLLPAAALAVLLSYVVQTNLSKLFKYQSLYEAQVFGRTDSPVHRIENLETVLSSLSKHQLSVPDHHLHFNLEALLSSGLPIDLPDGKEINLYEIKGGNCYIGRPAYLYFLEDQAHDAELVAVLRQNHTLLPDTGVTFEQGDRLVVLTTFQGRKELAEEDIEECSAETPT
jgi:chloride channel protein, CIC family